MSQILQNVWDYAIVIDEDSNLFRIEKDVWYSDKLSADHFSIQRPDKPCAFRHEYFDAMGRLREKYWGLPLMRIT